MPLISFSNFVKQFLKPGLCPPGFSIYGILGDHFFQIGQGSFKPRMDGLLRDSKFIGYLWLRETLIIVKLNCVFLFLPFQRFQFIKKSFFHLHLTYYISRGCIIPVLSGFIVYSIGIYIFTISGYMFVFFFFLVFFIVFTPN